ncbi:uncharacterized protein LOC118504815 [Anopheles stephensi]|uniref:uncharacterized protein LOC118504815 n=1 Tax=Anopheles stephensi TaxID=30069 RepID=UPI001658ABD3|nr:uncharacterized protein LOC118504815 [Anopheles stephensi]
MALWNQRDLKAPPPMNALCKSKHIEEEIRDATKTCAEMLEYYTTLGKFQTATAYLSSFCRSYRNRKRNMHGFQIMRRINQALVRMKRMNLVHVIMDLHSFFPESNFIDRQVNLPVRSNLEYLLVRMQGLAKLLLRVVYLTKEAARYHLKQIAIVFLYHSFAMFLGLMGELWLFARAICRRTVEFYNRLHPVLNILPNADQQQWLPDGYELPADLAGWLGEEYEREILYICQGKDMLELGVNSNIFNLLDHHSKDEMENELTRMEDEAKTNSKEEKPKPSSSSVPKAMLLQSLRSDTGVQVSRTGKLAFPNFNRQFNYIKSKFHVQQFIAQERAKRKERPQEAITKGISEREFESFSVQLMRSYNELSSSQFVQMFKDAFQHLLHGVK